MNHLYYENLVTVKMVPEWHSVVQLVEALRYKPEGGWFDSLWCRWNFSLMDPDPGIDSASNRKEYKEYFRGVKATDA
jgi:hypothetical protein